MECSRFKFRVWDKENKTYLDEDYLWLGSEGYAYDSQYQLSNIDYVVEQCTGLKDHHGKLIYEGDVLERNTGHKKTICFYQGGFGWWTEYNDFVSFSGHARLEEILQNSEIIGNIHELDQEQ